MAKKKKQERGWALSIGFYPGVLIGMRSYVEADLTTHVLYLPLVDLALEVDN